MTDEKNTAVGSIPWDLGRLPDFDYVKFGQVVDKENGRKDLVLSLEGRKTWFRLACPSGGLVLNALRVTDAMAIFEARVFADTGDRNPLVLPVYRHPGPYRKRQGPGIAAGTGG